MGYGDVQPERVHARTQARQDAPAQQVFVQDEVGHIHPGMDPKGLTVRESRDSYEHPESVAVAFIMDVTGSMGGIPRLLATETMRDLMPGLARINQHVQVLFGSVGDADDGNDDPAPLQVGQFETSDELADRWLTRTWLTAMGSRPDESYDLGIYFLGYHTSIDCWKKRGLKGYAFLTGDDTCRKKVKASTVNRLLGRKELEKDIPIQTAIAKAAEMYNLFFLIPDETRAAHPAQDAPTLREHWREVLGTNGTVIVLADPHDTAVVSSILFGLREGAYTSLSAVLRDLKDNYKRTGESAARVIRAVSEYATSLGIPAE